MKPYILLFFQKDSMAATYRRAIDYSKTILFSNRNGYFKILSELGKSLARLERLVGQDLFETKDSSKMEDK